MTEGTDLVALDAALIAAHDGGDMARSARLYAQAADAMDGAGNTGAAGFLYTQAYVCALDAGLPAAAELRRWLVAHGRELQEEDVT